jgi:hypothetical protein
MLKVAILSLLRKTLRNERLGQVDKGSDRVWVAPSLIRQWRILGDDDKET